MFIIQSSYIWVSVLLTITYSLFLQWIFNTFFLFSFSNLFQSSWSFRSVSVINTVSFACLLFLRFSSLIMNSRKASCSLRIGSFCKLNEKTHLTAFSLFVYLLKSLSILLPTVYPVQISLLYWLLTFSWWLTERSHSVIFNVVEIAFNNLHIEYSVWCGVINCLDKTYIITLKIGIRNYGFIGTRPLKETSGSHLIHSEQHRNIQCWI